VAPAMRGRVISYFAMSLFGMQPLGSLLIGTVSQYIGAPDTLLAEGLIAFLIVVIFWHYLTARELTAPAAATESKNPLKERTI
jgi:hypothetical protein